MQRRKKAQPVCVQTRPNNQFVAQRNPSQLRIESCFSSVFCPIFFFFVSGRQRQSATDANATSAPRIELAPPLAQEASSVLLLLPRAAVSFAQENIVESIGNTYTSELSVWKMSELLFDDIFKVEDIDPDGKKYDKVSRIVARSEKRDMYMLLDVNTEIYPINKNEKFLMALSPSLVLNTKDGPVSIQDKFEYIMHGRLYNFTNDGSQKPGHEVEVYASFGGLQMTLRGNASHCIKLAVDQKLFILLRKVES